MKRAWTLLLLAAMAVAEPPAKIELADDREGHALEYAFKREGDAYVRGKQRVPVAVVARLLELARTAPAELKDLPAEIPITAEIIERHRGNIEDAALNPQLYDGWVPETLEHMLSVAAVKKLALKHLVDDGENDTHWSSLTVKLGPVTLMTASESPWAQPWHVTIDGKKRTVYSLEVSKLVSVIADPRGYTASYLNGARYWQRGFWKDDGIWSWYLGRPVNRHFAHEALRELEGFKEADKRFRITDAEYAHFHGAGDSLRAQIDVVGGGLIDKARWFNTVDDLVLDYDWNDFAERFDAATAVAAQIPFFSAWKAGGKGRWIQLRVVGTRAYWESNPKYFLLPAWEHSKLAGRPEFALHLWVENVPVATMYFAKEATGCFIDRAKEGVVEDGKPVDFHPTNGRYATITPDGKLTRHKMPPRKFKER